jgi:hypothetical protein
MNFSLRNSFKFTSDIQLFNTANSDVVRRSDQVRSDCLALIFVYHDDIYFLKF